MKRLGVVLCVAYAGYMAISVQAMFSRQKLMGDCSDAAVALLNSPEDRALNTRLEHQCAKIQSQASKDERLLDAIMR
ncbi:hypothetical protein [Janthinobacterium sp. 61]|uniref:hypothetical protein n=1 Tax=Janthinobacterium sp. 61 TaxID=2035209 RepID=UPI0015D5941F|nr:hypothetical protein [Janthinobacterium sp. 61]